MQLLQLVLVRFEQCGILYFLILGLQEEEAYEGGHNVDKQKSNLK